MERFFIESEVDMKIRQAKKIMKQVYKTKRLPYILQYHALPDDSHDHSTHLAYEGNVL